MDIVTLALAKNYADSISSGITSIKTENNKLIFTLQNGNIIEVPLNDLISGLVTDKSLENTLKSYALIKDVPTKVSQLENNLDYVKNTDYATSTVAGVVKTNAGLDVDENGMVVANTYNYNEYESKTDDNFVGKGTLENVIAGKKLVNKTYVDDLVGNIDILLTNINDGGGVE